MANFEHTVNLSIRPADFSILSIRIGKASAKNGVKATLALTVFPPH